MVCVCVCNCVSVYTVLFDVIFTIYFLFACWFSKEGEKMHGGREEMGQNTRLRFSCMRVRMGAFLTTTRSKHRHKQQSNSLTLKIPTLPDCAFWK